jgi:hypothetical protein
MARFGQALAERPRAQRVQIGRCGVEESDHRYRALLSARRERPSGRRAANQRDDLASLHSIEWHLLPLARVTA